MKNLLIAIVLLSIEISLNAQKVVYKAISDTSFILYTNKEYKLIKI